MQVNPLPNLNAMLKIEVFVGDLIKYTFIFCKWIVQLKMLLLDVKILDSLYTATIPPFLLPIGSFPTVCRLNMGNLMFRLLLLDTWGLFITIFFIHLQLVCRLKIVCIPYLFYCMIFNHTQYNKISFSFFF